MRGLPDGSQAGRGDGQLGSGGEDVNSADPRAETRACLSSRSSLDRNPSQRRGGAGEFVALREGVGFPSEQHSTGLGASSRHPSGQSLVTPPLPDVMLEGVGGKTPEFQQRNGSVPRSCTCFRYASGLFLSARRGSVGQSTRSRQERKTRAASGKSPNTMSIIKKALQE